MRRSLLLITAIGVWLSAAVYGLALLQRYALQPGASKAPALQWPAETALARSPGRLTLVVALHPQCPCSQATVEELDGILARAAGRLHVIACFTGDPDDATTGEPSRLWRRVQRLPGVDLRHDRTGAEAHAFGFRTSGDTRLYGRDGALVFRGGITAARGHAGANPGATAVLHALENSAPPDAPVVTPVFGCALFRDADQETGA